MEMMKHWMFWLSLGVILTAAGCSGFGSLQVECASNCGYEVQAILDDFEDYHVYYAGQDPDLSAAILFDPRNDAWRIQPGRWKKVVDKDLAWEIIRVLEANSQFQPKFFRVLGAKDQVYGYLYTPYRHVPVKQQDPGVIKIYNLRQPAHLQYDNGGSEFQNIQGFER